MSTHMSTAPHQSRKKRELTRAVELLKTKYGGERGIRTLETLLTLTHFPGVLLQPLGHLTVNYCNSSLRCRQTVILPSQTFQAKPPLKLACRADLSAGNCTQIDL